MSESSAGRRTTVIVGNSNCVLRRGFGEVVSRRLTGGGHEVVNLSIGGSGSLYHVYAWHAHRTLLESADLVVLDSLVMDTSHQRLRLLSPDQVRLAIGDMYALYATLPGRVVSVLFPTERYVDGYSDLDAYRAHRAAAELHGVDVLDLYRLVEEPAASGADLFLNENHLRPRYVAPIADALADLLLQAGELDRARPARTLVTDPYVQVAVDEEPFVALERRTHSSQHLTRSVAVLDREVSLSTFAGLSAMGAFHWNREGESRILLRGGAGDYVKQLRGEYALFASFTAEPVLEAGSTLGPASADLPVTEPPRIEAPVLVPHLLGLLLKRPAEVLQVAGDPGQGKDLAPSLVDSREWVIEPPSPI